MNTKIRNILIFSIIVSFTLSGEGILNLSFVNAAPGWLTGWSYRKGHVINSATGAGTNYQIKIVVHKSSGTDSGENVYVGTNVRDDFGDVRFTDDNGTTLLDYWMETYTSGVEATFWVEVKDDLSSSNATIYVYYGRSDVTTTSNGTATFDWFDDFEDGDISDWSTSFGSAPELVSSPAYGSYALKEPTFSAAIKTFPEISGTFIMEWDEYTNTSSHDSYNYIFSTEASSNAVAGLKLSSSGYVYYFSQGGWPPITTQTWTTNAFHRMKVILSTVTDTYDAYYEGGLIASSINMYASTALHKFRVLSVWGGSTGYSVWDNILARKYVDPEPTHGSWFTSFLPGSPSSLGPTNYVNGSWISDPTPTLQFTQSDPDSSDTVKYRIQIDNNSNFLSPVVDYTSALLSQGATSFTVGQAPGSGSYTQGSKGQTLPSGSYYWRVMSEDQRGETDSWTKANSGNIAFKISIGKFYTGVKNTIYSSGAVTYSQEPNTNNLIDFSITPSKGSIEVTIFYWLTSDTYYKKWKETASAPDITTTHVVGDLKPNTSYPVKVDGVLLGNYTSNSSGQISFVYDLGYSDKIFEVGEPPDLLPTGNTISYFLYILPITFLLAGYILLRLKKRLTLS